MNWNLQTETLHNETALLDLTLNEEFGIELVTKTIVAARKSRVSTDKRATARIVNQTNLLYMLLCEHGTKNRVPQRGVGIWTLIFHLVSDRMSRNSLFRRMIWQGGLRGIFIRNNMRIVRGVHRVLVGRPEGKRPLVRPRRRWEDNIKMHLQEVGGGRGDWKELVQDRDRWRALVGTVRNFRVP
jgi:hypothetical protein